MYPAVKPVYLILKQVGFYLMIAVNIGLGISLINIDLKLSATGVQIYDLDCVQHSKNLEEIAKLIKIFGGQRETSHRIFYANSTFTVLSYFISVFLIIATLLMIDKLIKKINSENMVF